MFKFLKSIHTFNQKLSSFADYLDSANERATEKLNDQLARQDVRRAKSYSTAPESTTTKQPPSGGLDREAAIAKMQSWKSLPDGEERWRNVRGLMTQGLAGAIKYFQSHPKAGTRKGTRPYEALKGVLQTFPLH